MKYSFSDVVITGILRIIRVDLHAGAIMHIPDRASCGLIIALKGRLRYDYHGDSYISDENHALLFSQGITYSFVSETDSSSIVINFSTQNPLPFRGIVSFEAGLANFGMRMENLWTFEKHAYTLRCMAELYDFLAKYSVNDSHYIPSAQFRRIKPSIDYLESHYTDPNLSNDELAAVSGISTVYFRKLFMKRYGISPMRYVRQKRIEKAKNLLESQYYTSISDVAEASGFSCLYYFSKAFKLETSHSPSEYIALHSGAASEIPPIKEK
nr:helix-turn-helix transcriptional regulator [Oscillospiraceae bacterium]